MQDNVSHSPPGDEMTGNSSPQQKSRRVLIAKIVDQTKMPRPIVEFYMAAIELRETLEGREKGAAGGEEGAGRLLNPDALPLTMVSQMDPDIRECSSALQPFFEIKASAHPVFQQQLKAVRELLEQGGQSEKDLFHLTLAGESSKIEEIAFAAGCDGGLLSFLVRSALRTSLAPDIKRKARGRDFGLWRRGDCPACGSKPHLGYVIFGEKDKTLCCSFCGQHWAVDLSLCPFCGTTAGEKQKVEAEILEHVWAEVCSECGSYIKIMDTRATLLTGNPSLDDLASMHLDYVAAGEGYTRPIPAPA
jgi:FdhE protein